MEYKLDKMGDWERQKAVFLIGLADKLKMNLDSYGEVAVNETSGYTYLWIEDYNFSLYMPINCELVKHEVIALWSCSECGQEEEYTLKDDDCLADIEREINEIEQHHKTHKEE